MFTGIIEEVTSVLEVRPALRVGSPWRAEQAPALGESVAVDGVCLTVVAADRATGVLSFDLGSETRRRTTLGRLAVGHRVHLERALRFGDRLGGHLVSGHVDGVGTVRRAEADGASWLLEVEVPADILRLSAAQGSVALAGVSLTVNALGDGSVQVGLVPHTLERTTLGQLRPGDAINCEADLLARYVARLLPPKGPAVG
jgi:riboflavin synthase